MRKRLQGELARTDPGITRYSKLLTSLFSDSTLALPTIL